MFGLKRSTALISVLALTALPAYGNDGKTFDFAIKAQSLDSALKEFSHKTHVQLIYSKAQLGETLTGGVSGDLESASALEQLLQGSNLSIHIVDATTIAIRPKETRIRFQPIGLPSEKDYLKNLGEYEGDLKKMEEMQSFSFDEIVVTATKRAVSTQDLPMAINTFGADRIEKSGVESIGDLQFLAPGLQTAEIGGQARITLRGVGPNGGTSGTAVHLDGVVLSSTYAQSRALFDLERVEVLRGPQGTLYGRNATGGSINFITKSPTVEAEAGGEVTYTNYHGIETEGYVSGPLIGEKLTARIAFKTINRDGFTPNVFNGKAIDNEQSASVRAKIKYEPTDTVTLNLMADYTRDTGVNALISARSRPGILTLGERHGGVIPAGRAVNQDFDDYQEVEVEGLTARLDWDMDNMTFTSLTGYRQTRNSWGRDSDGTDADAIYYTTLTDVSQISQEFNLVSAGNSDLEWIIGAYLFDQNLDFNSDYTISVRSFDFLSSIKGEITSYAVFGEASYPVVDKLTLTLGGRYSYEEAYRDSREFIFSENIGIGEGSWQSFTPRAALTYTVSDDVTVYASVAKGFKAGGLNPLRQVEPYGPETVISYETGVKALMFDRRLRTNAAVFYMDYKDFQVFQRLEENGLPVNRISNAGGAPIKGVELEFDADVTDQLRLDGNLAYLDAVYENFSVPVAVLGNTVIDVSGNRLINTPKWSLNMSAEYTVDVGNWGTATLRGEYSYRSSVFFNIANFTDIEALRQSGYSWFNARLTFEDASGKWRIAGFVKNIANEVLKSAGNLYGPINGFKVDNSYYPPRMYGVSVAYHF